MVRQEKAYPVYDETYAANVAAMRADLERRFPTLHMVGRNGMHRYNNQDHAMMTARLTVENIKAEARIYDIAVSYTHLDVYKRQAPGPPRPPTMAPPPRPAGHGLRH